MLTQRQQSGRRAEDLAAEYLSARGCEILERNYRRRLGELDLVAREGGVPARTGVLAARPRASTTASSGASRARRSSSCSNGRSWRAFRCGSTCSW